MLRYRLRPLLVWSSQGASDGSAGSPWRLLSLHSSVTLSRRKDHPSGCFQRMGRLQPQAVHHLRRLILPIPSYRILHLNTFPSSSSASGYASAAMVGMTISALLPSTSPAMIHQHRRGVEHLSHRWTRKYARCLLCVPMQACCAFDYIMKPFDFTPHVPPQLLTHIHVISTQEGKETLLKEARSLRT